MTFLSTLMGAGDGGSRSRPISANQLEVVMTIFYIYCILHCQIPSRRNALPEVSRKGTLNYPTIGWETTLLRVCLRLLCDSTIGHSRQGNDYLEIRDSTDSFVAGGFGQ